MVYERIRNLREDADLTQNTISEYLNISQRSYSHFENGTRGLPIEIVIKLADYYNISVDYLLNRTDQKEPYPRRFSAYHDRI